MRQHDSHLDCRAAVHLRATLSTSPRVESWWMIRAILETSPQRCMRCSARSLALRRKRDGTKQRTSLRQAPMACGPGLLTPSSSTTSSGPVKGGRKAPILWQIGLPSGHYSVWLYGHRLTRDSLFEIQNDVIAPKLAHEERQLASMRAEYGNDPAADRRREIEAQGHVVEELRAMLEEVRRVAPLWDPSLNDGVPLTVAPLWRLIPQHKVWRRELKAQWEELVAEGHEWARITPCTSGQSASCRNVRPTAASPSRMRSRMRSGSKISVAAGDSVRPSSDHSIPGGSAPVRAAPVIL